MKHSLSAALVLLLVGTRSLPTPAAVPPPVPPPFEDVDEEPSGFLLGSPVGVTTDRDEGAIAIKLAGFDPGTPPPPPWPTDLPLPKFDRFPADCMPPGVDLGSLPPAVLAMSMGLDVIYVEKRAAGQLVDGEVLDEEVYLMQVGGHGWMAIELTVDQELVEDEPVDALAHDVAVARDADELDATVFSYLVPGSVAAMLPTEGETVRAMAPDALDLAAGDRIHALSMHTALYYTDLARYEHVFTTRELTTDPHVYFTLRPEFLAERGVTKALEGAWGVLPDSGTIFVTQWDPTAGTGGEWSTPALYARWNDLGLTAVRDAVPVIDGLAIDAAVPGALGDDAADDEIMLSLAPQATADVPPEQQMLYVTHGGGGPPRRVVVIKPDAEGYGSLGRELKIGKGHGDFCTKDPFVRAVQAVYFDKPLLDDFFVARRLWPDGLFVSPYHVDLPFSLQLDFGPSVVPTSLGGPPPWRQPFSRLEIEPPVRFRWPVFVEELPVLALPGTGTYVLPPMLALAVSGYRQLSENKAAPVMRTCMSWPRPAVARAKGVLRWGFMPKYFADPTTPGAVHWLGKKPITYEGEPLVEDLPLPTDGLLRPPGVETPEDERYKAWVAQWQLQANGRTYISPISALRY